MSTPTELDSLRSSFTGRLISAPAEIAPFVTPIAPHLNDASALVRGAAIWALAQLVSEAEFENLRAHHLPHEVDETAREEWRLGKAL